MGNIDCCSQEAHKDSFANTKLFTSKEAENIKTKFYSKSSSE